jgi:hypothetical protein
MAEVSYYDYCQNCGYVPVTVRRRGGTRICTCVKCGSFTDVCAILDVVNPDCDPMPCQVCGELTQCSDGLCLDCWPDQYAAAQLAAWSKFPEPEAAQADT